MIPFLALKHQSVIKHK